MKDMPMGVSQWKNHGKKYGYWKFHTKALLEELLKFTEELKLRDDVFYAREKNVRSINRVEDRIEKLIEEQQ